MFPHNPGELSMLGMSEVVIYGSDLFIFLAFLSKQTGNWADVQLDCVLCELDKKKI